MAPKFLKGRIWTWQCCRCSSGPYLTKVYGSCELGTDCGHKRCKGCHVFEDPLSIQQREEKPSARSTYKTSNVFRTPAESSSDEEGRIWAWQCCRCSSGPYLTKVYGSCELGTDCGHKRCKGCHVFEDPLSIQQREEKPSARSTYKTSNVFRTPAESSSDEEGPTFRPRAAASGASLPSRQRSPESTLIPGESLTSRSPSNPIDTSDREADSSVISVNEVGNEKTNQQSASKVVPQYAGLTIEDLSDNDVEHEGLEVIRPDQTEDAANLPDNERGFRLSLEDLAGGDPELFASAEEFQAAARRRAYQRRKKRWNIGGYNKRTHEQSIDHDWSDDSDVEQLPGTSSRRLRRRTGLGDGRIKLTALMFDDPPTELEELHDLTHAEKADGNEDLDLILPQWFMDQQSEFPGDLSTSELTESRKIADDQLAAKINELIAYANSSGRSSAADTEILDNPGIDLATAELHASVEDDHDASDAETCYADSVASIPYSNWSSSTIATDNFLADELADFLWFDGTCQGLATAAISKSNIGQVRFERNFKRLLRAFAMDLAYEATSKEHHAAATFVRLSAATVAKNISSRAECRRITLNEPIIKDKEDSIPDHEAAQVADSDDEDFMGPEAADEDHYNLMDAKDFLSRSQAMRTLGDSLGSFVCPPFHSILSAVSKKELDDDRVTCYMSELLKEFTIAIPETILFTASQPGPIDHLKLSLEHRTGQEWDWWPCSPPKHTIDDQWVRVEWQTTFGLACWRNIPLKCRSIVDRALKEYRVDLDLIEEYTPRRSDNDSHAQSPGYVDRTKDLLWWSRLSTSWQPLLQILNGGQNQGTSSAVISTATSSQAPQIGIPNNVPSSDTSCSASGAIGLGVKSATAASVQRQSDVPAHVLLLVKSSMSEDHGLSQIKLAANMTTPEFFKVLRKTYLRGRGLARYFSVWKYHHCDFYRSIRFLPAKFTPRTKNNLPPKDHSDYRICDTARTRDPPPILPIEFYWGYYLSNRPILARLRSWWRKSGRHQDAEQTAAPQLQLRPDILRLLPRKVTQLDEAGVTHEEFWNILAVERICLRWVIFWNVICMLPALGFFFLWLFKLGGVKDMQNASVPLTIVIMLEGLFWTLLWASTWDQASSSGPQQTH